MAKKIKDGKLFYHVTALDNLEPILRCGLLSRNDAIAKGLLKVDVADPEIIAKRQQLAIDNYVPFHFFEPTAFTGAIKKKNPNKKFCTITISRDFARSHNFKICTAHPLSSSARILDYETGMEAINWDKAELRDYHDAESKNACMAECLAVSPLLPNDFFWLFVPDQESFDYVDELATKILNDYQFDIRI